MYTRSDEMGIDFNWSDMAEKLISLTYILAAGQRYLYSIGEILTSFTSFGFSKTDRRKFNTISTIPIIKIQNAVLVRDTSLWLEANSLLPHIKRNQMSFYGCILQHGTNRKSCLIFKIPSHSLRLFRPQLNSTLGFQLVQDPLDEKIGSIKC